jgi:hypothetical protein
LESFVVLFSFSPSAFGKTNPIQLIQFTHIGNESFGRKFQAPLRADYDVRSLSFMFSSFIIISMVLFRALRASEQQQIRLES